MRRICKYCNKYIEGLRTYCDYRCRILYDILIQENGCWEWQGLKKKGYGYLRERISNSKIRKYYFAHRISYQVFKGEIPKGLHVCHSCDNPGCVNPEHLWLGTDKDNSKDKINKNRDAIGEKHGSSKMNDEYIKEIRRLHSKGISQRMLSELFNINNQTISKIVNRKSWKHIE